MLWENLIPVIPWKNGEYNETNTLLLDDSLYKALRNPDNSHCTRTGCYTIVNNNKPIILNELKMLWKLCKNEEYNETNTLLSDDSLYKALRNPVSKLCSKLN
ncbi:hypothetical protein EZV62_001044 [Acer yangbiense]|uniref:FCP1 homology domain-containing protein n=1 Tax=Acer yangbiense TaxID=1000413 RepID=A0A5C7ITC9_9ROSI|nr:hypothetical protein EZV62_001044 [Acer yangbiense]